ncbi:DUF3934 domain-containing protein [Bacillus sp. DJP31]|uniref:DUF3934 domain-containing protein n=1 Tax=Bacillus sp. DJP31 TaxID=3409789 RepID=UPI003BB7C79C
MTKAKAKSGTGRGTDKKGWKRWQASANKAKSFKPYTSKGVKAAKKTGGPNDDKT